MSRNRYKYHSEEIEFDAEAELAWINTQINKKLFEISYKDNIINDIDNNIIPGLTLEQTTLEQAENGIIAKMESEKPIKSIFYLSNY
ncbi:MAG: hypothetical protein ABGW74_04180, partial [Campylobacterales bacterium]